MLVGAKVCDLTEDLLWFVCGLYMGILTSSLTSALWMDSVTHKSSHRMYNLQK